MDDRLLELRTTGQTPDTAIHRPFADGLAPLAALDQLRALDMGAAHRAALGNLHRAGIVRATLGDHLHHLRNHVTGTANDHRVADHQAQARHFIHVVQGRIGDGHAGHLHWLEARNRSNGAGTTDLELHIEQLGELLHGRELVGNRPARLPRTEAQFTLRGNAVDLEHHTIDFIRQGVAALADITVVVEALADTLGQLQLATDRHAPLLELLQETNVRFGNVCRHLANAIAAELQRATGGDLRIQLAQAPRRRVTRVGEGLAAGFQLRRIEALETGLGHIDFATHLQGRRPTAALQLERNIAHRAHVDTDVFARGAVTARGAAYQHAILVQQADRQAIELGFAAVLNLDTAAKQITGRQVQAFGHPTVKLAHVGFFEGVAQAEHRHFMTHLGKGRQRRTSDPLGG
ncbi:hypothetical protein D3C78_866860 [compost metagenome]